MPYAHASLLAALDEHLHPPEILVIRGEGEDLTGWAQIAQRTYAPRRLVLAIPTRERELPGTLRAMEPGPKTRAYYCRGTVCGAPLEDLRDLQRSLAAAWRQSSGD
jgi:uncharacterized protein YyaL (SSP411 family)